MKRSLAAIVMFAAVLNAKEPPRNHQGTLLRMESVACGPAESNAASNAIFGTPAASDPSGERLCPEYILRSEGLLYRIRQRAGKRANLLPIGARAQFRFDKFRMLLQVEDFDRKVYEFHVMAIIPETTATAPMRRRTREKSRLIRSCAISSMARQTSSQIRPRSMPTNEGATRWCCVRTYGGASPCIERASWDATGRPCGRTTPSCSSRAS